MATISRRSALASTFSLPTAAAITATTEAVSASHLETNNATASRTTAATAVPASEVLVLVGRDLIQPADDLVEELFHTMPSFLFYLRLARLAVVVVGCKFLRLSVLLAEDCQLIIERVAFADQGDDLLLVGGFRRRFRRVFNPRHRDAVAVVGVGLSEFVARGRDLRTLRIFHGLVSERAEDFRPWFMMTIPPCRTSPGAGIKYPFSSFAYCIVIA